MKLLHIHRFCPADMQFSDALVSSAVVVFEKSLPPPRHTVRFTHGGTLLGPQAEQAIPLATLRRTRKWTNYPEASPAVHASNGDTFTLDDLFTIKRGLATGANDFFIRPREEVESWRIPVGICPRFLLAWAQTVSLGLSEVRSFAGWLNYQEADQS